MSIDYSFRRMALSAVAGCAILAAAAAGAAGPTPGSVPGTYVGPSSSETPYVTPVAPGWEVVSLITVGDMPKFSNYPMVGIPDGMGAVSGKFNDRTGDYVADRAFMTVFMNHELGNGVGSVRAHGQTGAFISQWTLHVNSLTVTRGQDLIHKVMTWNPASNGYADTTGATAFSRFCSADLPGRSAFYNPRSRKGYKEMIFMNGEETGSEGRAFAHIVSGPDKGTTYELPYLGKFSWENSVAHPNAGDNTIVIGLDDSTPGQVYVYVGEKRRHGNPMEKAGLQGGKLFGVKLPGVPFETGVLGGKFMLEDVSDLALGTGAALQTGSRARLITEFARPEDGAWDTRNPRVFYFVTTGATNALLGTATQNARLYKLTFDSLDNPSGGAIEMVVDRSELDDVDVESDPRPLATAMFDNITVDEAGNVLIQEDPGNNIYAALTWKIDPSKPKFKANGKINPKFAEVIFTSDRNRFAPPVSPYNADEENSGIIEVTDIVRRARWAEPFRRYYLGVMQAHYPNGDLVEGGQLYLMASSAAHKRKWWDGHDDDRDDDLDRD
jgi:hypothetical protein